MRKMNLPETRSTKRTTIWLVIGKLSESSRRYD